jgi:hypothetical protein
MAAVTPHQHRYGNQMYELIMNNSIRTDALSLTEAFQRNLKHGIAVFSHKVFFQFLHSLAARRNLLVGSHLLLDHKALVASDFSLLLLLKPLHLFLTFLKENQEPGHSLFKKFNRITKYATKYPSSDQSAATQHHDNQFTTI